ncbi:MAG: ribulose-phosphate 3-epimerase [Actinobacteria bacterium]|nr:ribulose-phosphate 3-epimerase [Actinomycetota bacterium]MCL5882593.1 ribulose-phosphate 3-epimerase [Actinomycetota bacterium]
MSDELINTYQLAPSILSADFSHLGDDIKTVMDAGVRVIHVDVMDGQFVPNITIGPVVIEGIRDQVHEAGGILDVHLMIDAPERYIEDFARAGSDWISVHVEACTHLNMTLSQIRAAGCKAGAVLNPATPLNLLQEVTGDIDYALMMTVNPGFSGQKFIASVLPKIERARHLLPREVAIQVDGGVGADTIEPVLDTGANLFVAGSAVFGAPDPAAAARGLMDAMAARASAE